MAGKKKAIRKSSSAMERMNTLLVSIRALILSTKKTAARSVNTLQVLMNFEIGRRIVEHEQQGSSRAEYGKQILSELAFLKEKILKIEMEVSEINDDLHQIRPDYLEKLKKIDKGKFISRAELERELG